jgi:hypothetical protein
VKARLIASGVAALAVASVGVPMALSGPASAKSTAAPTLTTCTPAPAIIGKTVTVHGTGLKKATSLVIGTKKNAVTVTTYKHDTGTTIKFKVPTGVVTKSEQGVVVTTANGTSGSISCTFQKAPKKSKK